MVLTMLAAPYFIANFIDGLILNSTISPLISILLYISGCYILGKFASFFASILTVKLHYISAFSFNLDIIEHVQKLPLRFFENLDVVYLNRRINDDSQDITEFVIDNLVNVFVHVTTLIGLLIILRNYDIEFVYILLCVIVLYMITYKVLHEWLYEKVYIQKESQNIFFSKLNEQFSQIKFIKTNSIADDLRKEIYLAFKKILDIVISFTKVNWLFLGIGDLVKYAAIIIVLFIGGTKVIQGTLSIGEFVVINSYYTMALESTSYFLGIGSSWQGVSVSFDRVKKIFDEQTEQTGKIKITDINSIKFNDVTIAYPKRHPIINRFSYEFQKGNIYCIIGNNGSGKSTLLNSIIGLVPLKSGTIMMNGYPIDQIDINFLRRHIISFADQDSVLLNMPIIRNIAIGCDNFTKKDAVFWINKLNLTQLIDSLPEGLNHQIDERIDNISGGEKQRISQIRTFIKNASVILLDEPTASLDHDSIARLKNILLDLKKNKIIIAVTHNDEFQDVADRIVKMLNT
jgi:ABC-type bacteriocin/lantibiotic exporter with double-glycine peptidase domain